MPILTSPGVSISVTDESMYISGGTGTVPLLVIATDSNKLSGDGVTVAAGTSQSNTVDLLTSQRDLLMRYGKPKFNIVDGTPLHGHETNEYGLMAAYSFLGLSNRAYIIRADVNLSQLEATSVTPTVNPVNGTYWLDLPATRSGVFVSTGPGTYDAWKPVTVLRPSGSQLDQYAQPGQPGIGQAPTSAFGFLGDVAIVTTADQVTGIKKNVHWKKVATSVFGVAQWNPLELDYLSPHYVVQTATVAGQYWFKTTSPNLGFLPIMKKYVVGAGQVNGVWVIAQPLISNYASDTLATAAGENIINKVYARIISDDVETASGPHLLAMFNFRIFTSSGWTDLVYQASETEPRGDAIDGTLWFNDDLVVDLYKKTSAGWAPIINVHIDTDAPVGASAGDVWVNTGDLENYPKMYEHSGVTWVLKDNADQSTPNGIVFADLTNMAGDTRGSGSVALLLDEQSPDPDFYPVGMFCFNAMVSTGNVKKFNAETDNWDTVSGNIDSGPKAGAPYMLRKAQRRVIVKGMQAALKEEALRDETVRFSLIACPGYIEAVDEMLELNVDRKETAFIIADTPLRLSGRGTAVEVWATGVNAGTNSEDGLVTRNTNIAVYYPNAITTDLDGNDVVVPASHAVLRTYAYNDQVAYPWFAPAGLQRGVVSNVSNFGYVNSENEFVTLALSNGMRDSLYLKRINPMTNFPGQGLVVFGQKTLHPYDSALDRVNVARLVCYLREQFEPLARPYIFEPNDAITRTSINKRFNDFLIDLASKRALYDFLVVCDDSNNTPTRIDRNEMYIDVAIAPVKAAEFIYIPIRVVNTGAI